MYDDGRVIADDKETYQLGLDIAGLLDRAIQDEIQRWLLHIEEGQDHDLDKYFKKTLKPDEMDGAIHA